MGIGEALEVILVIVIWAWATRIIKEKDCQDIKDQLRNQEKKRVDILNWLKSELADASKVKLTKVVDEQKIILLKKIIGKLK